MRLLLLGNIQETSLVVSRSVVSDSFATPWTVALQVPLSMGFPRQEYWSGLPFPSSGDLPNPGIESRSPALAGRFFAIVPPGKSNFEGCRVHSGSNAVDSTSQASEHKVCL